MSARHRGQRSQAMTEFALVAPVLLLLTFGIIDFGRALYFYVAAGTAAREAARTAAVANGVTLPTHTNVLQTAQVHFPGASVVEPDCVNGPIPSDVPSPGYAWVFTTEPSPGPTPDVSSTADAAGGDSPATAGSVGTHSCSAVNPAAGRQVLEVTVEYNFVPVTPLVSSVIGNHVVFTLQVVTRTEY
jgi:Flp pilus assembly protein TadG